MSGAILDVLISIVMDAYIGLWFLDYLEVQCLVFLKNFHAVFQNGLIKIYFHQLYSRTSFLLYPCPLKHILLSHFFYFGWWGDDSGLNSRYHSCIAGALHLEIYLQSALPWVFWKWGLPNYLLWLAWNWILWFSAFQLAGSEGYNTS
jgi:hypothetical protein